MKRNRNLFRINAVHFLNVINVIILFSAISTKNIVAQNIKQDYLRKNWKQIATQMPDEWYGSNEAKMVADSVLKYQTEIGGWPKNSGFHNGKIKQEEANRIKITGIGATFDNGATITEMKFLVKVYSKIQDERYRTAFIKGLEYIFKAQYSNGGWPQFYPFRKGKTVSYASHITFNDNSMVNILFMLKDIANDASFYRSLNIGIELKSKTQTAFDKGIDCILKTQISKNNKLTVWCAQHDENTLAPANARAYELASFCGAESVGITLLLMEIENPSQEIINAVNSSVKWFETHKINGIRLHSFINSEGNKDQEIVNDSTAPPLWARFYDLETEEPFFCDRDGIKRKTLAELGYNRRTGYGWYTNSPEKLLKKYPEWAKKWKVKSNGY